MLTAVGLSVAGIAVLVLGAELLVRGGTRLAARLRVSPMVIGLTVVSLGTSTPELAVGIEAAVQGAGSLAVGNIAGTNTFNILFILGLSALIDPLALRSQTVRLDLPTMMAAALALLVLAWDGNLSRADGALLLAGGSAYTAVILRAARRESQAVRAEYAGEYGGPAADRGARDLLAGLAALLGGIAIIVVGADWLVAGASALARMLGVSDALIGLTVVAIGTSSPELATTVVATVRKSRDIAVGNLLGSSVYNILFVLGATCLVPSSGVAVERALVRVDIPVMAAVTLLCVPVFVSGRRVTRVEGALFVAAYVAYLAYLLLTRV